MKQKILVLGVVALLAVNAYAQRPLIMAQQVTEAMTGGVASAFSKNVPLTVLDAEVLSNGVMRAQFTAAPKVYVSSMQLFKRVQANRGFKGLDPADMRLLETKFEALDGIVHSQTAAFMGYRGALWSERPEGNVDVLLTSQVNSMINLLDIQLYMRQHNNEFPQLFTVAPGGWLLATDVWTNRGGTEAVRRVLDILVEEQAGQANPEVVSQLLALYAGASNPIPLRSVVEQLQNWRAAHNTQTLAPQLPVDLGAASSLRSNAENLWLSMQIRLLQLMPNIELPQILKDAKVTQ